MAEVVEDAKHHHQEVVEGNREGVALAGRHRNMGHLSELYDIDMRKGIA